MHLDNHLHVNVQYSAFPLRRQVLEIPVLNLYRMYKKCGPSRVIIACKKRQVVHIFTKLLNMV